MEVREQLHVGGYSGNHGAIIKSHPSYTISDNIVALAMLVKYKFIGMILITLTTVSNDLLLYFTAIGLFFKARELN